MLFAMDENNFILRNVTPFKMATNGLNCAIMRVIIYDYDPVVGVLLLKDRLKMPHRTIIGFIIESRADYACR